MPVFEDFTRVSWWELHTFAGAFPKQPTEERRKSFEQFLYRFAENFPCSICGTHMKEHFNKNPIYPHTQNNVTLQKYIYDLHEAVNKRKGKPQMHTFEEVLEAFEINKPWKPFGGYPILPSKSLIGLTSHNFYQGKTPLIGQSNECGMEKVYLFIIIALSILLFIVGALAIYFFMQCRSKK